MVITPLLITPTDQTPHDLSTDRGLRDLSSGSPGARGGLSGLRQVPTGQVAAGAWSDLVAAGEPPLGAGKHGGMGDLGAVRELMLVGGAALRHVGIGASARSKAVL